ncbi:hypothetical protein Nepgr_030379 [Nepenthes gracilis]|uniref:Uncharacterized protein n=1 Tax=Nepenthes gracilis TaxID=150966 RepID=A0AAD3TGK3_NEPGR|nr:hypothetical protein Nepgr_030379 [Nepenthes gracilis]
MLQRRWRWSGAEWTSLWMDDPRQQRRGGRVLDDPMQGRRETGKRQRRRSREEDKHQRGRGETNGGGAARNFHKKISKSG